MSHDSRAVPQLPYQHPSCRGVSSELVLPEVAVTNRRGEDHQWAQWEDAGMVVGGATLVGAGREAARAFLTLL